MEGLAPAAAFETDRATSSNFFEHGIKLSEDVPAVNAQLARSFINDAEFKRFLPLALPEFVSQRDRALFEGNAGILPLCVRHAAPGDLRLHTVGKEQDLPGRLMHGARTIELLRVFDLSCIVHRDTKLNEARVEVDTEFGVCLHQLLCGLAHKLDVKEQPLRCTQLPE